VTSYNILLDLSKTAEQFSGLEFFSADFRFLGKAGRNTNCYLN